VHQVGYKKFIGTTNCKEIFVNNSSKEAFLEDLDLNKRWTLKGVLRKYGQRGRYSDSLRTGLSGDRIPVGSEIFRTRPDRSWDTPSLLYNGYRVFPGGKAAGVWSWPPTPPSAEVKEKVELYIYSPPGPSWLVLEGKLEIYLKVNTGTAGE
jgi:hypothetical protein